MRAKHVGAVLVLAVLLMLALPGCVSVNIGGDIVVGKGDVVKRSYDVAGFDAVEIRAVSYLQNASFSQGAESIGLEIIYRNGQDCKAELEMQENLFEYVTVSVHDGQLIVDSSKDIVASSGKSVKLYVTAPELKALKAQGSVSVKDADKIAGDVLDIDVQGVCDMALAVDVQSLTVNLSGAGSLTLLGTAQKAGLKLSGAGHIDALALEVVDAAVSLSGAGDCSLNCSETLKVELSGVGSLRYKGNAQVTQDVSGLGVVRKID